MTTDYIELRDHLEERLTQFGREMPGPMAGFARLHKKAVEDGALSAKVKEMMALAVSIAVGCEGCIAYHTHDAIKAGATRAELLETISVGLLMGGGPGSIYVAHALDAIEQFLTALAVEPKSQANEAPSCVT
jgi:AhpD family alkylhydroperoxidase